MRYTDMKEMRHGRRMGDPQPNTHKKYNVFEGKLIAGDFDTSFDVLLFFLSLCATMRAYIYTKIKPDLFGNTHTTNFNFSTIHLLFSRLCVL